MVTEMTTKVLEQIRKEIRELHEHLTARIDGLDGRVAKLEFAIEGMAPNIAMIPEIARLLREVADTVESHEARITRLEP